MSGVTTTESEVREQPKDITECCVCSRTCKNSVTLPCAHTFCLICLEEAGGSASKIPGERMPCPMCRKDFTIPEDGYTALQKHFFVENPLEMASSSEGPDRCEDCMEDRSESESVSEVPFAEMYCTDCQKKLCRECCRYHLKKKTSKNHQVVAIADFEGKVKIVEPNNNCIQHGRELDLYCSECKEPLCKSCFGESHQNHRLQDIRNTAEGFKNEITDILSGLEMCMSIVVKKQGMLSCEVEEYCKHLESLKLEVRAQLRATIMLVSEHANLVIHDIEQLKAQKRKEVQTEIEDNNEDLTCLESLKVFCANVLTKGSASDICCTIDELKERFEDIRKIHELDIEIQTDLHRMSFQMSDLEEFVKTENYNIIGTIQAGETEVIGEGETKIVYDNISHDGDKKTEENYGMAISCNNSILVKFSRLKQELDNAQRRIDGLEMEKKDFEKRIEEFRVELGKNSPLKSISKLQMTQITQAVQQSCKEVLPPEISVDYKRSRNLVKTMQSSGRSREQGSISSLTVLGDELFLGCFYDRFGRSVVEVYDVKTFNFKRQWHFKRLSQNNEGVARIRCMASCTRHKCLYACVSTVRGIAGCNPVIQRTDVNGTDAKEWKINGGSRVPNLSVTGEGNVIVISSCNSLIEYTRNGVLVHEIKPPLGFEHPWHALKLANGNFLVSHGCVQDRLQRVLLLSESGHIVRSFGEKPLSRGQSSEVKEVPQVYNPRVLNKPVYLTVDDFGNILVVDRDNNRIVVLNSDLELQCCLTPTAPFVMPNFMYIDNDRRQLFVCQGWRKIVVYNFSV